MIYKKDLEDYELKTMEDYYDYIVTSKINGQADQLSKLFSKLSKEQKKECLSYLTDQTYDMDSNNSVAYDAYGSLKLCIKNI